MKFNMLHRPPLLNKAPLVVCKSKHALPCYLNLQLECRRTVVTKLARDAEFKVL